MEGSDSVHRVAAPELALHLLQRQKENARSPLKKRARKAPDEDQVEIHDEKVDPHTHHVDAEESPHLDISA